MKKSYIFLTAAAALLTLASCTKEPGRESGAGLPMRVVASLSGEETKASIRTDDLQEFYLQVSCADAAYSYFEKVSKSGTDWSAARTLYWKDETTPVSYSAVFFGSHAFTEAEFTSGADLAVPTDQSTQAGLNAADLLTLHGADKTYSDDPAGQLPVTLAHGLVRVTFELTLGDAFFDRRFGLTDNPVTGFTVKGANCGFRFQPQTGMVTVTNGTRADITPLARAYTPGSVMAKTAVAKYEAILVPQSFAAGTLTVNFSIGSASYSWSNPKVITLAAGQTVTLPVSASKAPPLITMTAGHACVEMGDGLKWATCNIGADHPWDSGDYFAWGETEPYYSSLSPLTWKDGKGKGYARESYRFIPDADKNLYTKYCLSDFPAYWGGTGDPDNLPVLEAVDDAAVQRWGGSWRMPTLKEWTGLFQATDHIWQDNYNGSGVKGVLLVSKVPGFIGNSIFLPLSGYFMSNIHYDDGSGGDYWSSSTARRDQAHCEDIVVGGSMSNYTHTRFHGLSVRPVSE